MSEVSTNTIDQHSLFEQNCAEYYTYLLRQVRRVTGNKDDAEEITQTTFVQFLEQMERKGWKVEVKFVKAYLRKAAENIRKDLWKARTKERALSYDDENVREALERNAAQADDSVARMDARIYYRELYDALPNVVLRDLSPYEMRLIQLRRIDGLPLKEIAPLVGKEVCNVRYDLQKVEARVRHRARKIMARKTDSSQ